jgi:hypothetical protein
MNNVLLSAGERICPGCGSPSAFETPECDEHGAACPELACVLCGFAMVFTDAAETTAGRAERTVG